MPDESVARDEVLTAHKRTVECGSARVALRCRLTIDDGAAPAKTPRAALPHGSPIRRRLAHRVSPLMWRLFVAGIRRFIAWLAKRDSNDPQPGVVDLAVHRCVYHPAPGQVTLIVGDQQWRGAPGTMVSALGPQAAGALNPLWLLDLVGGVADATEHAAEDVNGRPARRFSAHADVNRAAEAAGYGMAIPSGAATVADLTRIPLDVYVDEEGQIGRIHYRAPVAAVPPDIDFGRSTTTLDVVELGVTLPADWSRLPHPPDGPPA